MRLPPQVRRVLASPALAHLVTLNPDGTPQLTVVWADVQADEVVFFAERSRQKIRNIHRDPRVVVSLEDPQKNANGLPNHLVLRGHARIVEGPDLALQDKLATVYMGLDRYPFANRGADSIVVVRVTVDRISGFGPYPDGAWGGWVERGHDSGEELS